MIATVIGFAGGLGLFGYGAVAGSVWTMVMAGFLLMQCAGAFRFARRLKAELAERERSAVAEPPPLPPVS